MFAVDSSAAITPNHAAPVGSTNMDSAAFAGFLFEMQSADAPEVSPDIPETPAEQTGLKSPFSSDLVMPGEIAEDSSNENTQAAPPDSAALAYAFVITLPAQQVPQTIDEQSAPPTNTKDAQVVEGLPIEPVSMQAPTRDEQVAKLAHQEPALEEVEPEQRDTTTQPIASDQPPIISAHIPAPSPGTGIQPKPAAAPSVDRIETPSDMAGSVSAAQPGQRGIQTDMPSAISEEHVTRPASNTPVILEARITKHESLTDKTAQQPAGDSELPQASASAPVPRVQQIEQPGSPDNLPQDREEGETLTAPAKHQQQQNANGTPHPVESISTDRAHTARATVAEQAPQTNRTAEDPRSATAEKTPLKTVEVRIPDGAGGVTVRMQERAGSVQVSVRSADPNLASKVAEGLPDLTRTLDRQGFRAEMWTPQETKLGAADSIARPETMIHRHSEAASSIQAEAGQTEFGQSEQDNNQHRQRKPDWEEEQNERRRPRSEENFEEYLW
jgi:hypothetical protein